MTDEQVSTRILTIPNLVSFTRLAATPVFWWLLISKEDVGAAALLFIIISWTDWIDGFLARKLNQVTRLGKALDPVADRLMIASALLAGLITEIVPLAFGIPLLIREVYVALVAVTVAVRKLPQLEVRYMGKLATFLVYGALQSFYLAAVPFLETVFRPMAWTAGVSGLILYFWVAVHYTRDARNALSQLKSATSQ